MGSFKIKKKRNGTNGTNKIVGDDNCLWSVFTNIEDVFALLDGLGSWVVTKEKGIFTYRLPNPNGGQDRQVYTWEGEVIEKQKPHGQGQLIFVSGPFSGDVYVGEYKNGYRNGQGTYTIRDGATYVGEWKDGEWNKKGTVTYPDGHSVSWNTRQECA